MKWDWGIEQNEAFEKIKELLTSAPILTCPDFSKPFQLEQTLVTLDWENF